MVARVVMDGKAEDEVMVGGEGSRRWEPEMGGEGELATEGGDVEG